jgi:hypothetical protein
VAANFQAVECSFIAKTTDSPEEIARLMFGPPRKLFEFFMRILGEQRLYSQESSVAPTGD